MRDRRGRTLRPDRPRGDPDALVWCESGEFPRSVQAIYSSFRIAPGPRWAVEPMSLPFLSVEEPISIAAEKAPSVGVALGPPTCLASQVAEPRKPSIVGPSRRFSASKSFGKRQPAVRIDDSFERAQEGRPSVGRGQPRVVSGVQAVSSDSRPKGSLPRIRGPLHPASPPAPGRRAALLTDPETFERLARRRRTYARKSGSAKSYVPRVAR